MHLVRLRNNQILNFVTFFFKLTCYFGYMCGKHCCCCFYMHCILHIYFETADQNVVQHQFKFKSCLSIMEGRNILEWTFFGGEITVEKMQFKSEFM